MSELWNSVDSLGRLNSVLQLGVAIAGVLTAILGALVWMVSERLAQLEDLQKSSLQARVQIAETQAAEARKETAAISARQRPRSLTQPQQAMLLNLLRTEGKGSLVITAVMSDPEAERFALELYDLFRSAGWSPQGVNLAMMSPAPTGMFMRIRARESPPTHAALIQGALAAVQIEAPGVIDPKLGPDTVELVVGHKP